MKWEVGRSSASLGLDFVWTNGSRRYNLYRLRIIKEVVSPSSKAGKSLPLGPMILRGERKITANHAVRLGSHFGLRPDAFL